MNKRRAWSALAFGVTLAIFPVLASAALAPSELLAKHKAFMGWAAGDPTVPALKLTIVPGKLPDTVEKPTEQEAAQRSLRITEIRRGLLYRVTREYGKVVATSGFTGRVFWDSDYNANTVKLFDDDARLALSEDVMESNSVALLDGVAKGKRTRRFARDGDRPRRSAERFPDRCVHRSGERRDASLRNSTGRSIRPSDDDDRRLSRIRAGKTRRIDPPLRESAADLFPST